MNSCYGGEKKAKVKMTEKKSLDELAGDLAFARLAMITMSRTAPETAEYRLAAAQLFAGFAALDNAGVFQEIDEHTGYEPSEDTVERAMRANLLPKDPGEWGDLSGYQAIGPNGPLAGGLFPTDTDNQAGDTRGLPPT